MTARSLNALALVLGPAAAAGSQLAGYALVHDAAARGGTWVLRLALVVGVIVAASGIAIAAHVLRRRRDVVESDRFVAVLAIVVDAFFLFVVLVGFGLPTFLVHPTD